MFESLDEDDLRRAAHLMNEAAKRVQGEMAKAAFSFGKRPAYSTYVSTGTLRPSIRTRPFAPFVTRWKVVTSPNVVEKKRRSRRQKRNFWQRLWDSLTDGWPYSRIEYYEVDVPAIVIDRINHSIICHPSLEIKVKKAVREGDYESITR